MVNAINNDQAWGWYAYDTASGAISLLGLPYAYASMTVNSYVGAARYMGRLVHWINTEGAGRVFWHITAGGLAF